MLEFNSDGTTLIASKLAQGDKFVQIYFFPYGAGIQSIVPYTVEKVLKRDIICKSQSGKEMRLTVNNHISSCYSPDSPKVAEYRKELKHKNRCKAAYDLMTEHLAKNQADEELLAAIEAYGERVKAKQQG